MIFILLVLGIIVALVVTINKNIDLTNENNRLRYNLDNIINFCPKCGYDLYNKNQDKVVPNMEEKVAIIDNPPEMTIPHPAYQQPVAVMPVERKRDEKEIKNSFILIVGSILIVLSAIIFLATTWNVVDNMVKTFVLLLMLIVFYGISYLAEHQLKLKQAANTFYYIALAYIPIVFLSIAMFSLFGEYLSLYGEGKFIYLAISSIIVNIIYYINAKNKNNNVVFIFSIIFQLLGITFLSLSINDTYNTPLLSLIIYNTVINFLYLYNKIYYKKEMHYNLSLIITLLTNALLLINTFTTTHSIFNLVLLLSNFINVYIVTNKLNNLTKLFQYIYPAYIVLIFFNISTSIDTVTVKQILLLLGYTLIYIYDLYRYKRINMSSFITLLVTFPIYSTYCALSTISSVNDYELLPPYICLLSMCIYSFMYWFTTNKYKLFPGIVLILSSVITIFAIVSELQIPSEIAGYLIIGILVLSMFVKDKSIYYPAKYISLGTLLLCSFDIYGLTLSISCIFGLTGLVSLLYVLFKKNDEVYKISSYVFINIFLFCLCDTYKINYAEYVIPLTTLLFIGLEEYKSNLKTLPSKIYMLIGYGISALSLGYSDSAIQFVALTVLSLLIIYYIIDNKLNKYLLALPVLGMCPYIYGSYILLINEFNYMYIISLGIIIILGYLMYNNKHNIFTILYFLLTILHVSNLEIADYLGLALYIAGCTICYLTKENNKTKDFYQGFLYFFIFLLGKKLISDIGLYNVALFNYGLSLLFVIALTRTIFKKYGDFYKVIEYIFTVLVNFSALCDYNSEFDGILYVALLVGLVIVSYNKKYGPIFITSLVFIVLNVFLLTREFWFNVPWWLYVLALGGILIGFAINNEAKDNQNKSNTKEKVKELKEYLDM